jgi:ribosomal protein S18 acetylase RimI-like enzyme
MAGMRVWRASPEEVASIAGLMARFRDHLGKAGPPDDEIHASVERILADPGGEFLLGAADEGEPLGICQLRYRWSVWTSAEDCWLEDLYVLPDARRFGLGRALVDEAVASAVERGCMRIELDVDEDNDPALALYRGAGFSLQSKGRGRTLLAGRGL